MDAFEKPQLQHLRQACTPDQTGKVEFVDVNLCVITEDDFEFVT